MKKILFVTAFILISCGNNDTIPTAKQYSIEDIHNHQNFYWYQEEYNKYIYDSIILDTIANKFNKYELKIIIYTFPNCGCRGSLAVKFPQIIKVLDSSNIFKNNYEIFVISNVEENNLNFKHPYSNIIEVTTLPAIYLIKLDTLYYNLLLQVNTKKISIEQALLDGLKFFE